MAESKFNAPLIHARWVKFTRIVQPFMVFGATTYLVLFHNFGPQEHVFSPARRFFQSKVDWYVEPNSEEMAALEQIKSTKPVESSTVTSTNE
eukprot:m.16304 g.16304  ORF g.16304 m.16304 type:complete len:92 (+) comp7029_c0_seq2:1196-1471(+)